MHTKHPAAATAAPATFTASTTAAAVALACALLTACGGGSGSEGSSTGDSTALDSSVAEASSATATAAAADSTAALDATAEVVVAAQAAVQATAAADVPAVQAQAAGAVATMTVACSGGGTMGLTIQANQRSDIYNGVLDAGEVYTVSASACAAVTGGVRLDGNFTLTVRSADTVMQALELATGTGGLVATLPAGAVTLSGSGAVQRTVVVDTSGIGTTTTHWTSPLIALGGSRNSRSATLSVSALDLTRVTRQQAGTVLSTTLQGQLTLGASSARGTAGTTLVINNGLTLDSGGNPQSGQAQLTIGSNQLGLALQGGTMTLTIDQGADGSVERTLSLTLGQFLALA